MKTDPIIEQKVIGVGSPILDIIVSEDDDFIEKKAGGGKGGSVMISAAEFNKILDLIKTDKKIAPGGSAANTIFGLTKLGVQTEFLGAVGEDDEGKFYCERYKKMGGNPLKIRVKKDFPTGRCLCMISPDSQRTMRTDLGAAISLSADEVNECDFEGLSHLHVEGYMLFNDALSLKILRLAKNCGLRISLDLSSFEVVRAFKNLCEILSDYVDIVFANEDEAAEFTNGKKPEEALNKLSELCEIAVVKLGKEGAIIRSKKDFCKVPAKIVDAVDTTGAGDMWATGFLYGIFKGKSLYEAGTYGAIVSSEVVKIFGADISEKQWRKIIKTIKAIAENEKGS
ncbi:MAG TPA: adenosine kinase [Victivallales bacterium]|nr:adenosine kinase [Victivallales bacterium]